MQSLRSFRWSCMVTVYITSNTKSGDLGSCWSLIDHDAFHCIIVYSIHDYMFFYRFAHKLSYDIIWLCWTYTSPNSPLIMFPLNNWHIVGGVSTIFRHADLAHLAPRRLHRGSRSQYLRIVCRVGDFFWVKSCPSKTVLLPAIYGYLNIFSTIGDIDIDIDM